MSGYARGSVSRTVTMNRLENWIGDVSERDEFKSQIAMMFMIGILQHRHTLREAVLRGDKNTMAALGFQEAIGPDWDYFFEELSKIYKDPEILRAVERINKFADGWWDPPRSVDDCPPDIVVKAALRCVMEHVDKYWKVTADPRTRKAAGAQT